MMAAKPRPSALKAWASAVRPATLLAAVGPVSVGAAAALHAPNQHWFAGALALLAAITVQVLVNIHNDVEDFERGADNEERLGEARAAQKGWLSRKQLRTAVVLLCLLSLGIAGALTWMVGWPVLIIGIVSVLSALAYTGGPYPLAYNGLGDVFVFIFFGWVAVVGSAYVISGVIPAPAFWAAIPVGCLSTAILVVNNLRDRKTDLKAGKNTLVARFGEQFGRAEYVALVALAYLSVIYSIEVTETLPPGCYGIFLTFPFALSCIKALLHLDGVSLNPWLGKTAALGLATSLCLAGGMIL